MVRALPQRVHWEIYQYIYIYIYLLLDNGGLQAILFLGVHGSLFCNLSGALCVFPASLGEGGKEREGERRERRKGMKQRREGKLGKGEMKKTKRGQLNLSKPGRKNVSSLVGRP